MRERGTRNTGKRKGEGVGKEDNGEEERRWKEEMRKEEREVRDGETALRNVTSAVYVIYGRISKRDRDKRAMLGWRRV